MLDAALSFVDGWTLVEDQLVVGPEPRGALFTTSNGYIGVRGAEREPVGAGSMVLVCGCHEMRPYAHPERSFGAPERYQTIVPVTDPTLAAVTVDGIAVVPGSGTWLEHRRVLDMRTGCVTTTGRWRSPRGVTVNLRSRRMVSMATAGLLWTEIEVEALDGAADVAVVTEMGANTGHRTFPDEPEALGRAWGRIFQPHAALQEGRRVGLVHATAISRRTVACVADAVASADPVEVRVDPDTVRRRFEATIDCGRPFAVSQRAAFADGRIESAARVLADAGACLDEWSSTSFDDAVARQREILDSLWEVAAVDIDGDDETERAVRFSTFQVLQASALRRAKAFPAKGLSGQGYEGHHLWDQEVYVDHVLSLVAPDAARAALSFRCATLPQARARAAELSHAGAQFPWRTIDGTEASAFFPAGAAQYHVNAAIAWAIVHHVACTGDDSLLADGGLEVLVETARLWMSIGGFSDDGRFRIAGVTGPDEYTALVDDNLYTNVMAARNLVAAADQLEALRRRDVASHAAVVDAVRLQPEETATWRRAAEAIAVPYDDGLGVHAQDDTFLLLPRWDLEATPPEAFPLQDHHHLLTLYRHQVLKQADVVLALMLVPERFEPAQRRRDFDYYEPLTTHDSSLSAPIHAVVAADVGRLDLAWDYLRETALTDLESRYGTLADGLHLAAAAGSWLAIACGFGGLRVADGCPALRPRLPPGADRLCFRFCFRGSIVEVDVDTSGATYRLLDGDPVDVDHDGALVRVDGTAHRPLATP